MFIRENKMRTLIIALTCSLLVFFTAPQSSASDNLIGTHKILYKSKAKVKGFGSDKWVANGILEFMPNNTWSFIDADGFHYSGTWTKIKKGKKIRIVLSSSGKAEVKEMLKDWMVSYASWNGAYLTGVYLNFTKIKISDIKIHKKTGIPTKCKFSVKGKASGYLNGVKETSSFKFQCNLIFAGKIS